MKLVIKISDLVDNVTSASPTLPYRVRVIGIIKKYLHDPNILLIGDAPGVEMIINDNIIPQNHSNQELVIDRQKDFSKKYLLAALKYTNVRSGILFPGLVVNIIGDYIGNNKLRVFMITPEPDFELMNDFESLKIMYDITRLGKSD